ncbi:hypothetical protein TWF718_008458 [Orbilia javanica]|uniref:Uncharacterized protein n=1 Tax=Orbilia javanica TaxID=47235 RepID=A0AAN8MSM7_9PEZI
MSQQEEFPFPYSQGLPATAWPPTGTPMLTPAIPTIFPTQPVHPDLPMISSGMPSSLISPMPGFGPMPMPTTPFMPSPVPTAASSAFSTPFGTVNGIPPDLPMASGQPGPNNAQALEAIFGPVPDYAKANTSHYNLGFQPPPYKNFVPAPIYIENSTEDLAYQNVARENYRNGLTTDPWRNQPIPDNNVPQFVQRFEDLSFADQMRGRRLRRRYNNNMTDAQRRDMDRRRLQRTESYEPELDEEIWESSPGCRCTIL